MMKLSKRILVTVALVSIMATLPNTTVKAVTSTIMAPIDEKPIEEDDHYLKNIEAVFSDGTTGQFLSLDGHNVIWSTRTTTAGDTNHDIIQLQYRVQPNDCLWNISTALHIPLNQLLDLNPNIKNPNLIYIGDTIVLMLTE